MQVIENNLDGYGHSMDTFAYRGKRKAILKIVWSTNVTDPSLYHETTVTMKYLPAFCGVLQTRDNLSNKLLQVLSYSS